MNRLLLIPCVASCLAFVFLASSGRVENARANHLSELNGVDGATADAGAEILLSSEQVQDRLINQWKQLNSQKLSFSRVYRPQEHYRTPGILVDATLPVSEGSFVGVFILEDAQHNLEMALQTENEPQEAVSKREYPIVVDRRTGDAVVFASGTWTQFDQWAVTGD